MPNQSGYPYDESKADFADNGKVYVNTTNKNYAIPDTLKGFDINTSSNAFGLENRFYYKVYGRDDLRFANQYSANEYLWDAAKENGLSLDRVTGIFSRRQRCKLGLCSSNYLFIYRCKSL
ncbi:MAG: hypothetical protein J6J39_01165 [Clostridia bacterium]|nr:hypothetical protein [Clostridia bacterium]